jgi:hypothetical protein
MRNETAEYRKVKSLYEEFEKNICGIVPADNLNKDDDYSELDKCYASMTDGMVIEICFWHESDIYLTDFSVEKQDYNAVYDIPFEEYLKNMGLYTENIEEAKGIRWKYCGPIDTKKTCYRVQYVMED